MLSSTHSKFFSARNHKFARPAGLAAAILFFCIVLLLGSGVSIAANKVNLKGYPQSFTDIGVLDDKAGDSVVINDVQRQLAPGATYNTPGNLRTGLSAIKIGNRVGFVLDESGRIKSLWLMPEGVEMK